MASIRKSLAISFLDKYFQLIIQFTTTIILARLLTPEEIGIFSVGVVVVSLVQMIRDFGISNYLIQEQDLTKQKIRSALGVTLITAWSIAVILLLVKGFIAEFYAEPGINEVITILSISLFFIPFNSTVLALFRRNLNFKRLMIVNVCSSFANASTAILLAYNGFGFSSLAWASVSSAATTLVVGVLLRDPEAEFIPSFQGLKGIIKFGSFSTIATSLSEMGQGSADLTIGKNLDVQSLGYYSRGTGVVQLFNFALTSAVQPVILPSFSNSIRNGISIKESYLKGVMYFSTLAWPFYSLLALIPLPIIDVLYGAQWHKAAPIVPILCAAFSLQALSVFAYPGLIAMQKIDHALKIQIIIQPIRIAATIFASFYGLTYVAGIQIIYYLLYLILVHYYLHRLISISLSELIDIIRRNIQLTLICMTPTVVCFYLVKDHQSIFTLLTTSTVWGVSFIAALFITKNPISSELKIAIKNYSKKFNMKISKK